MFDSILPISYYHTIAELNKEHNVSIVQHCQTSKIYIKKELEVYNLSVLAELFYTPVRNTPRIYALYENDNKLTLIEEYISGDTLSEVLEICKKLPESDVIKYAISLCDTLSVLHSFNPAIIHRDIKPSNTILTEDGRIVLIDFNAAKLESSEKRQDTILLGTEDYAAPEQFGFGSSTPQTDIYALGVLMNTLLTGSSSTDNIASGRLHDIISHCLEISPKDRYRDAKALKSSLLKISKHSFYTRNNYSKNYK